VYCIQTAEDIVKLLSQQGSTISLVFNPKRSCPFSRKKTFSGALNTPGCEKSPFILETVRDIRSMVAMER